MNNNKVKIAEEKIALFDELSANIGDLFKKINFTQKEFVEKNDDEEQEIYDQEPILVVKNVQKYYSTNKKVLDDITFKVYPGEFFGIVGESGSGKSTLGKIIIRITPNSGGTILFDNRFISSKKLLPSTKKWLSQNIQMVFQSPISSLNPKKKVLDLVKEPLLRSDLINKHVETLIEIHKTLNYIFNYRIKITLENLAFDFEKKYYAVLLFAYFTFFVKYEIYKYYLQSQKTKNDQSYKTQFLNNISALSNKYKEDAQQEENNNHHQDGFTAPLYSIENAQDLQIYNNVSLNAQQQEALWNNFINDQELLDFYDISIPSHKINSINELFDSIADADDFMINAVDELDSHVKLVLNIATKYFVNVTDLTKNLLKRISRKDLYPKEKNVIEKHHELSEIKKKWEHNIYYDKIHKIINKKKRFFKEFKANYEQKTGLNAKNILITYLSTSKEEIASVKRSLLNYKNQPILFMFYDIKQHTLQERYNVIKTFNTLSHLTSSQIEFLIEKVWIAIQNKYQPLFDKLREIDELNNKQALKPNDLATSLDQLRQNLNNTWQQKGKDLPEYKKAVQTAKKWAKENQSIYHNNEALLNKQVQELSVINEKLQKELEQTRTEELKRQYDAAKGAYQLAIDDYLKEFDETDAKNKADLDKQKQQRYALENAYDGVLSKYMNQSFKNIKIISKQIKENSSSYGLDKDNLIQDLLRVKTSIASTFAEAQEIIQNIKTYSELYLKQNPSGLKNKLIKLQTKLYVFDTLESVGLKQEHAFRYIYEFSGGQRQRIAIARALVTQPRLIIADEPISALDVSIQAQVVNIMKNLAKERGITFLFIAHDLSMVHYACDNIIIINKGHILEKGDANAIFENPCHPYTRTLLKAVPELSNINLDLSKESEKVNQPYGNYNPIEMPTFYSVSLNKDHFVYGTSEQIKEWNPNLKTITKY